MGFYQDKYQLFGRYSFEIWRASRLVVDTGLHYLNWSDVQGARITGMTRYAPLWVEKGEIKGPITDMRFDDSLYSFLGPQLEAVTSFNELMPEVSTYGHRQLGAARVPGLLLKSFSFTL